MKKFWSKLVQGLEPYTPGEQPSDRKYIKLNSNENPYPPSPIVLAAMKAAINEDLRLYPDTVCKGLRKIAAQSSNLKENQVFVGNGSDEILAFAFMAFFNPGRHILFPDITYTFYEVYCKIFNIDYTLVPLEDSFCLPLEKFFGSDGGVVIANPNAPTGIVLSLQSIKLILDNNPECVVILDEAYIDFGGESAVSLVDEYPNLLVIQTLSKSRSLAGLRVGIAYGHEDLITALEHVKNSINSYTLDRIALIGAEKALEDNMYFNEIRSKVINTREKAKIHLADMGFTVLDSKANFLFISHSSMAAERLFKELRDRGILVRYFNRARIDNFLRVSIGTDEEIDIFLNAVEQIIKT